MQQKPVGMRCADGGQKELPTEAHMLAHARQHGLRNGCAHIG